MAINYADKFAPKVDERFSAEALSAPAVNKEYDFVGVSTVKVYSVNTVPLVISGNVTGNSVASSCISSCVKYFKSLSPPLT